MATIALAAFAKGATTGLLATPGGLFFAGVFANILDQTVLFPWLFPADDIEGERITDVPVSKSGEGAEAPTLMGNGKVEGLIAYRSAPTIESVSTSTGGKGGPDLTNYVTRVDLLVLFAADTPSFSQETSPSKGMIREVLADGESLYSEAKTISFVTQGTTELLEDTWLVNGDKVIEGELITDDVTGNKEDFEQLQEGLPLQTSGFTNGVNNFDGSPDLLPPADPSPTIIVSIQDNASGFDTRRLIRWRRVFDGDPGPSVEYIAETGAAAKTITQVIEPLGDAAETIEFLYFEDEPLDPAADSLPALEAIALSKGNLDPADLPGYAHYSGVFLGGFNVTKFGGRLPIFQAVYEEDALPSNADLIRSMLERADVPTGRLEFEIDQAKQDETQEGIVRRGNRSMRESLVVALAVGDLQIVEWGGALIVRERDPSNFRTIPEGDLGAQEPFGNPIGLAGRIVRDSDVTNEVLVDFTSSDNDYEVEQEPATSPITPGKSARASLRVATMNRAKAREIAVRQLGEVQSDPFSITLPPSYFSVKPSDHLRLTQGAIAMTVEVRSVVRQPLTGVLEVQVRPVPEEKVDIAVPAA